MEALLMDGRVEQWMTGDSLVKSLTLKLNHSEAHSLSVTQGCDSITLFIIYAVLS